MRDHITISIFDIFKPGPGPSSSHTIGPMKAASDFLARLGAFLRGRNLCSPCIEVYLYGSLSATGRGHGTHRAVMGGLLGWEPESCDCKKLQKLLEPPARKYTVSVSEKSIPMISDNIHFAGNEPSLPFQNTIIFRLLEKGDIIFEEEYYSIGGRFIQRKGENMPKTTEVPNKYRNMNEFRRLMRETDLSLKGRHSSPFRDIAGGRVFRQIQDEHGQAACHCRSHVVFECSLLRPSG